MVPLASRLRVCICLKSRFRLLGHRFHLAAQVRFGVPLCVTQSSTERPDELTRNIVFVHCFEIMRGKYAHGSLESTQRPNYGNAIWGRVALVFPQRALGTSFPLEASSTDRTATPPVGGARTFVQAAAARLLGHTLVHLPLAVWVPLSFDKYSYSQNASRRHEMEPTKADNDGT